MHPDHGSLGFRDVPSIHLQTSHATACTTYSITNQHSSPYNGHPTHFKPFYFVLTTPTSTLTRTFYSTGLNYDTMTPLGMDFAIPMLLFFTLDSIIVKLGESWPMAWHRIDPLCSPLLA